MKMRSSLLVPLSLLLTACDPGLEDDSRIYNDSGKTLTVRYAEYKDRHFDTLSRDLPAGEVLVIYTYSGLGDKSKLECCNFNTVLSISSPSGPIKKPINCETFVIVNKKKLRRYGNEPIKCEFHIGDENL